MWCCVKKNNPEILSGLNRLPEHDEFGFESETITDVDHDFYLVLWSGTAGETPVTVTRLNDAVIQAKKDERELAKALSIKLTELEKERNIRADGQVGTSDGRAKNKTISRAIKLLRKELKGTINPNELDELNAVEALDNSLDSIYATYETGKAWLESPARTLADIQGYDVVNGPGWPA